jgi:hypothetical protein
MVLDSLYVTGTTIKPLVASSGLSIQYAIMMGLVHAENHKESDKVYCPSQLLWWYK